MKICHAHPAKRVAMRLTVRRAGAVLVPPHVGHRPPLCGMQHAGRHGGCRGAHHHHACTVRVRRGPRAAAVVCLFVCLSECCVVLCVV